MAKNRKLRGLRRIFYALLCQPARGTRYSGSRQREGQTTAQKVGNNCCGLCDTKMNNSPAAAPQDFSAGIRGIGVHCFGRMNDYHAPAALVRRHANKVSRART